MNHLDDRAISWHYWLDVLPDGVALVDEGGIIRHVNEFLMKMTGYARDELVGQAVEVLVPSRYRGTHVEHRRGFSRKSSAREMGANVNRDLVRHDGSELAIDVALVPIQLDEKPWIIASIRNATERRATESARRIAKQLADVAKVEAAEALAASERSFRNAFEQNMAPIIFTDLEDRVTGANEAFCQLLGRTKDELLGNDLTAFTHPKDVGITEEPQPRLTSGEIEQALYVKRYLHKDGSTIFVEVSKSPARDATGKTLYHITSIRDITDRRRRDHVLELLTEVNKLATSAFSGTAFLQGLCDVLVEQGGYKLAWIGVPSGHVEGDVEIAYSAGATDYLSAGMVSWSESKESGLGPTGIALRTGATQVVSELATSANFELWRERGSSFGFGSSVTISSTSPVERAALSIYAEDPFAFDELTVKGLEEIVREAEFAITHVRSVRTTERALDDVIVANNTLRETERHFRLAFENTMAPMIFTDLEDRAIAVNDAYILMLGRTREETLGHDSTTFTHPEDVGIGEEAHRRLTSGEIEQAHYVKRYLHKDGRLIVVDVLKSPALDESGKTLYFVVSQRDITEERELTEQLSHQALHDPLTGLANRTLFEDRLAQAHSRVVRQGGLGAVLLLDLDDFKGVNDTHGHLVGDQLLVAIARRLEKVTRSSDTLCRFGGDEFLYLAEGLNSQVEAEKVAARLLNELVEPFSIAEAHIEQHASMGIVVWDEGSRGFTKLIQDADVAMYEAKREGKGHHVVFTPSMREQATSRFALLQELRHALQAGELSMHYQPIVDLATTEVVGFEALMRWQHPERGWVPPDVFIPLAEQSDLIVDLGSFALREAMAAASSWEPTGAHVSAPYVTVNLSAHQFHDPSLISMIEDVLRTSGLAPERLIIEITESVTLLDVAETMSVMEHLSRFGIGIALDDFGTGYSSLSYLALLNPKIIKIDQSFVSPTRESIRNSTLLETIVSLGRNLNTTVLAEGIETHAQLERLRNLGCELGQGYLFSPAVPVGEVAAMLDRVSGDQGVERWHCHPVLNPSVEPILLSRGDSALRDSLAMDALCRGENAYEAKTRC